MKDYPGPRDPTPDKILLLRAKKRKYKLEKKKADKKRIACKFSPLTWEEEKELLIYQQQVYNKHHPKP
jgi:hypothetical protein